MDDVRTIRRRLRLTQAELATKLGVDQSTVSRLETGHLEVDGRTALALDALQLRAVAATPEQAKAA